MFVCSGISMHTFQLPPFSLWNATRSQRSTNVEMFGEYRWNKASSYSVTCVIFKDFMFLSLEIMVEVHYLVACCSISDCLSRECFGFCSGDRRSVGVHTESAPRVSWLDSVWDSLIFFTSHCVLSWPQKLWNKVRSGMADPGSVPRFHHNGSWQFMAYDVNVCLPVHLKWNISQLENKASAWFSNYSKASIHNFGASWAHAGECEERLPRVLWQDQGNDENFVRDTLVTWLSPFFRI